MKAKIEKQPAVVTFKRVSTDAQETERQESGIEELIEHFKLADPPLHEARVKVSGTMVLKNQDYIDAIAIVETPQCDGMAVWELDRWFRLKTSKTTIGKWAAQLIEYVKPFEVRNADGSAKLIYTTLMNGGKREFVALNLLEPNDQKRLKAAVEYNSENRETIANMFNDGKESARRDPELKVDEIPNGVEFIRHEMIVDPESKKLTVQLRLDPSTGRKKTRQKGYFVYTDYAYKVALPIMQEYGAGVVTKWALWLKYSDLHQQYGAQFNPTVGKGKSRKNSGFTMSTVDHILKNKWWLGIKCRLNEKVRDWDTVKDRYTVTVTKRTDSSAFETKTNLSGWVNRKRPNEPQIPREPLIDVTLWDAVQDRLAIRANEYKQRIKHDDSYLARPLLHCAGCGSIMRVVPGSDKDARNKRADVYQCAKQRIPGVRKADWTCNAPKYKCADVDAAIMHLLERTLLDVVWIKERAAQKQKVEKEAANLEASLKGLRSLVAECQTVFDNFTTAVGMSKNKESLTRNLELQDVAGTKLENAKKLLLKAGVPKDTPVFDLDETALAIVSEILELATFPVSERKELLAFYLPSLKVTGLDESGKPVIEFPEEISIPIVPMESRTAIDPRNRPESFNEPEPGTRARHTNGTAAPVTGSHRKRSLSFLRSRWWCWRRCRVPV